MFHGRRRPLSCRKCFEGDMFLLSSKDIANHRIVCSLTKIRNFSKIFYHFIYIFLHFMYYIIGNLSLLYMLYFFNILYVLYYREFIFILYIIFFNLFYVLLFFYIYYQDIISIGYYHNFLEYTKDFLLQAILLAPIPMKQALSIPGLPATSEKFKKTKTNCNLS